MSTRLKNTTVFKTLLRYLKLLVLYLKGYTRTKGTVLEVLFGYLNYYMLKYSWSTFTSSTA